MCFLALVTFILLMIYMLAVLTAAFSNDRVGSPGVALHIGTSIHNYDNGLNISIHILKAYIFLFTAMYVIF